MTDAMVRRDVIAVALGLALALAAVGFDARPLQAEGNAAPTYSHRAHQKMGLSLTCEGCHGASSAGVLKMPGADNHKPCANQACHAADFREADSPLCYVCHEHNEPWRQNPTRGTLRDTGEFYVSFSHKGHLGRAEGGALAGKGCQTCHAEQAGVEAPPAPAGRMAPQHGLCASCHESLSEPRMTACGGCHMLEGEGAGASSMAEGGKWRVKETFRHEDHRKDVRTAEAAGEAGMGWERYDKDSAEPLNCQACHGNVLEAGAGDRLPRPTMKGCGSCHDGSHAFKVTGFSCARCHGSGASAPSSAPASAPAEGEEG